MEHSNNAHIFFDHLTTKYPSGSERLENEIKCLKRKLHFSDFNSSDDEDLCKELRDVEAKCKKRKMEYACDICGKTFSKKYNKTQHMKSHCISFHCGKCGKSFYRDNYRKRHEKLCVGISTSVRTSQLNCKHCGVPFETYELLFEHVMQNHPLRKEKYSLQYGGDVVLPNEVIQKNASRKKKKIKDKDRFTRTGALKDAANKIDITPNEVEMQDILHFFSTAKVDVEWELDYRRDQVHDLKWYLNVRVEMVRNIDDGTKEKVMAHFRSKTNISLKNDDNEHNINEAFQKMNASLEEYIHKGSNWVVNKIFGLEVHTAKYAPVRGSSHMELPPKLRFSRGVVNIKNDDQKCFLWSILAALHPVEINSSYVEHYKKYERTLDMTDIEFPVSLPKIGKFEKQNNLSINVFGYEEGQVFPLYLTKVGNGQKEVNLLYLSDDENSHYCWIKNLSRFLGHTRNSHTKLYYCHRCLHGFIRQDLLDSHRPYCERFDFQKVEYPKEGKEDILHFKDNHKTMKVPFVIYADFEALACRMDTCSPNPSLSSTTHETKFETCGFAYQVVCTNNNYTKTPVVYRGDNAVNHFLRGFSKKKNTSSQF